MKLRAGLTSGVVISILGLIGAMARSSSSSAPPLPPPSSSGGGGSGGGGATTSTGGGGDGAGGAGPTNPPPAAGPLGPNDRVAPFPFAGRKEVETWAGDGLDPLRRHDRLMALARGGGLDPLRWTWVPVRKGLEVQVSNDLLAFGGIRLCCSVYTAQQLADVLGVLLCTPAIVRAAHRAARTRVPAQASLFAANPGGGVPAWLRHQDAIQRAATAAGWNGSDLISSLSKDYCLAQYVVDKPQNSPIYGWSFPTAERSGPAGEQVPMIQSPKTGCGSLHGGAGGLQFFDYSHGVRVVGRRARLLGVEVDLRRIYATRSELVSHLGNVETIPDRHPSVPVAAGSAA